MVIYKITNLINQKIYIGQTTKTANKRFHEHIRCALNHNDNKGGNRPLCNAIRKYGKENFKVEVIDTANTIEELCEKEKYWIEKLNARNKKIGYNIQGGGISGDKPKSTRKKIGKEKKKDWENPELAEKMLAGLKKGTEKWQEICKSRLVEFVCPVCGKKIMMTKSEYRNRKYCSRECAYSVYRPRKHYHQKEPEKYNKIRKEVNEWCKNNVEIIENTPHNKIKTNLLPLWEIANQNGVYDWRTFTHLICDSYSRKDFLDYLKRKYMLNQSE